MWAIIAAVIAVAASAGVYYQQRKMEAQAKKQAQEAKAVQISGHDSNRGLYTVYGKALVGSTTVWKKVSDKQTRMTQTGFTTFSRGTGDLINGTRDLKSNRFLYRAVSLCAGPIQSVENILIDDEGYQSSRFGQGDNRHFAAAVSLGPTAGQNFSAMRTSYSDFNAWGTSFTGKGVAYAIERLYLDNDKPAYQGEPSTKYLVKGRKLYDPRKDSTSSVYDATLGTSSHRFDTPSTWEWSDNPVLALLDYMTNAEYGRGLALSVIDLPSIADSADKCDVLVDIPARLTNTTGSSYDFYDPESGQVISVPINTNIPNYRPEQGSTSQQKRFRINIAIDPSKELLDNIQEILNVFRGNLSYANGKYRVHMADVASPVLTIGDDDIITGLKISNGDRAQRMNRATVKFINANKQHKTDQASWPSLDSNEDDGLYDTFVTEDQGEKLHKTFTIKGCTDFYQAQDTAEFLVRDSRSNLTVAGTFGSRCFGLVPGDIVSLTYDSAGYSGKYFRVMQVAIDLTSMNVNLQLKEYDSSVYTWNDARGNEPEGLTWQEEVVNASPTTPVIGTLSSTTRTRADGSTALTLTVPFSNIPEQAQYVDVEWGISGTDQYNSQVVFDTENINQVEVPIERDNATYAVRVRYFIADSAGTLMASTFATDTITVGNLTGTKLGGIEEGATANNIYQQASEPTGGTYNDGDIWIDTDDGYRMYLRSGGAWVDRADARIATAITDAAGAQATADGKVVTFYQDGEPAASSSSTGDLWIDTNDNNKLYRYNGSSWDSVRDSGIASAISAAATAQSTADGKIVTFYQDDEPADASSSTGDLWFDTNDNNKLYRYNGTDWVSARDSGIAAAISAAAGAQSTADGKVVTFYQDGEPAAASSSTGDLWIDTNDNNKLYRFNGTTWDSVRDAGIASAISSAATAQSTADGKIVTFYQDGEPAAASSSSGDLWFDTNDNNKLYRYNGTDWVSARDAGIADALANAATAQSTADGKIVTFYQDGEPAAASSSEGDLWIDTNDSNKLYRFNGTDWVAARDSGIASAISDAATAQATADGKVTTFYAASSATPTPEGTGDLWYQTDTALFFRYNGSAWQEVASYNTGVLADRDDIDLSFVTDAGDVAALDSITETYISDDAISTPKIKAGAITVAKLKVTGRGSALNSDPNCQDSSAWERFSGSNATFTTITDGEVGNNVMRSAAGMTWYNGSEALALDPDKTYRMTAIVRKNATANGTLYVGVAAFTQDGTNIGGDGTQWSYGAASGVSGSTSWTRYTMEFGAGTSYTFPSNAVTFKPIVLMNYGGSAGYFEAQDVRIEEKVGADLIVDGSITAEKLDANTITGDKISTSSYVKAGSGANSAIMSGRATDNFAFWAGADFDANGGASGANAPFRVTRAGKVIMTNFALYSTSGQKLFDSTDGLLGLPSTQVAASTGSLVSSVSDELTSSTDYATIQLSSTQTITVDFDYPLNYLFASGSSEANAYGQIATSITVTIQKSTDASTWSTFGAVTFNKTDSSSASSSQYYVQKQTVYLGSEFGGGTLYFASLQPGGAVDDGNVLNGNVSASLATGTHYLRMQVSYGGSGLAAGGIPSTTAARSITLTTTGAGFTVDSSGTVSDGVSTSATTGWVLSNFVEKTESDNVTINGTLTLGGDLVVNGTTTTINSTTLEVDDLNVTLASGAANAAAADGAGITIDGANAALTYNSSNDRFNFNKPVHSTSSMSAAGNFTLGSGSSTGVLKLKTYNDAASEWHLYNYNDDTLRFNYNGSGGDEFILNSSGLLTISGGISDSGGITSTGTIQGNQIKAQSNNAAVVSINDSSAANDTDLVAYVSFQREGTERGWLGFGSAGNDFFRLSRTAGDIQLHPNDGNVDITTGGLEVGGVSVIDSSRGITGTAMSINSAGHAYLNINGGSGYESGVIWKTASTNKWETYIPATTEDLSFYSYTKPGQVFRLYSGGGAGLTGNLSVTGKLQVTHSSSGLLFEDIGGNATLWLDGSDGDFAGADYFGIRAVGTDKLSFLYATGEKAYVSSSGDFYTSNDMIVNSRLVGGIGARTTAGTTDWNHSSNARSGSGFTLLLGNATNGPGENAYFHPFSFEYNQKDGTGNMTQFAIPYAGGSIYWRTRYSNSWTSWSTLWSDANDGSGSGLDADKLDSYHQTDFVRLSSSSGTATNGNFAIGEASSRNFIQSHNSQPLDINPIGNDVNFGSTSTSNTTVNIIAADDGMAQLRLYGSSQGTGRVYVGQSTNYGGGIEYNGDGTPASTGSPSDSITLFRNEGGTLGWTAYNAYNDDHWIYKGDVRTRGQIRATGWWGSATTNQNGLAAEIGVSAGRAHLISYNRSSSAYGDLTISAPDIQLSYGTGNVTIKSGKMGIGLTAWDNTNLALDINGHTSIRRGSSLYFGVNSTNFNSWETKFGNSGSTAFLNAQVFLFDNSGYGSEKFLTVDVNGAALGNYGTYSGGTAARTLALHGNASSTYTGMLSLARAGNAQYYLYEENGYYKYQGQGAGIHQFRQSGSTVVAEISDDEILHQSATGGKIRAVSITNSGNNASVGATWQSSGGYGMFMEYYPNTAIGYLQNSYNMSPGDIYGDIHIRQMSGGNWQTRLLFDNDQAKAVFQETVEVDSGTSSTFRVLCDNDGNATIEARGEGQGTGIVYVGQSTTYGGGIEYNGDGSPATTGAGSDYFALFRREGGTNSWTARNYYSNNNWEFREQIKSGASISANNTVVMRAAHYANSGSSTGAILIQLPGTRSGNYSMPIIKVSLYEYSSRAHNVYYISGHNWTSGWYNNAVTHTGPFRESVKLVGNSGTNKDGIIIGSTSATRSYIHVTVEVIAHPAFYQNNQTWQDGWSVGLITSESGWSGTGDITQTTLISNAGNRNFDATTSGRLYFGGNARFEHYNTDSIKHQNQYGNIFFGPLNSGGAHIYTDRARFYFNARVVCIENHFSSYNADLQLKRNESDTYKCYISTGGLVSTQNVTAYSDRRLKTDIEPITGALDTVMKLQGVKYTRIDSGNRDIGFIAQEIEEKCPEIADRIVNTADDEMGTKNLNYQNMVALLTEAIKTQQQQIEALTARIEELEHGDD